MTALRDKYFTQSENITQPCPLCNARQSGYFTEDKRRLYLQCGQCRLVYVPQMFHLSAAAEQAEYDKHQNNPLDSGYRRFLGRTLTPLVKLLRGRMDDFERAPNALNAENASNIISKATTGEDKNVAKDLASLQGLDFGCGPGPAISVMLAEQGIPCANYDPIYRPDSELLSQQYDFITVTEVAEHLRQPAVVFEQLAAMLVPSGILAVMTKRLIDDEQPLQNSAENEQQLASRAAFNRWHYKNDPTHIAFYSEHTMRWIARRHHWKLDIVDKDVVFFHR